MPRDLVQPVSRGVSPHSPPGTRPTHDLVLTKLTRNADRDRGDVEYLATAVPLDVSVLRQRYQREMRPYVGLPEREDLTLDLWIEIIQEAQRAHPPRA